MKKFFKFVGAVAAIGAGVAGGLFLYNKIKENQNGYDDDFDDDYDDDFSDDDDDERGYVNINPGEKDSEEDKEDAED